MSVYLDASVLVALFTHDAMSAQADAFLRSRAEVVIVSDFAAAELASAIARKVRMGNLSVEQAQAAFSDFDAWMVRSVECSRLLPADIAVAATFLRRLNLSLRAPDAMNIAIAQRVGATLATLTKEWRWTPQRWASWPRRSEPRRSAHTLPALFSRTRG